MPKEIKKIEEGKYEVKKENSSERFIVDLSELERTIIYMEKEYLELAKIIEEKKQLLKEIKKI